MSDPAAAYGACEAALRRDDRDRWLAALFVPADKRPFVHALYAFALEIGRVRDVVSDPTIGEIRLQWWRDILEGVAAGEAAARAGGHPTAVALLDAIARAALPVAPLLQLLEARSFDLYDSPMPQRAVLDGYLRGTSTALMQLAATAIDGTGDLRALGDAGAAYGLTGVLCALPVHAARGQIYLPADLLAEHGVDPNTILAGEMTPALGAALGAMRRQVRGHLAGWRADWRSASPATRAASLPASLCALFLRSMEGRGFDPFRTPVAVPQWRRQWALWRAAR